MNTWSALTTTWIRASIPGRHPRSCSGWQLGRRSPGNTGADWWHGSGKLAEDGGGGRDAVRGSARLAHLGECARIGVREFGLRKGDQSPLDDPDGAHHDVYASSGD